MEFLLKKKKKKKERKELIIYKLLSEMNRECSHWTFQKRGGKGGGGRSGKADWDSKWGLSIDPCTKCHFMGGSWASDGG